MKEAKIIYQDVSPDAKLAATYTGTNVEDYADYQTKLNNASNSATDFATLENNYWRLNGLIPLFPEVADRANYTWGFVSSTISDSTGDFAAGDKPILTINFSTWQASVALTMDFNMIRDEFPTSVTIAYYQNSTLLEEDTYTSDSKQFCFVKEVEDYNKIVITFNSTNVPYRRLRLINIYYGIIRTFSEDELVKVGAVEELDPISTNLSINTMNFSIKSTPEIPYLFQSMQPIQLYYDGNLIGHYYVTTGTRKSLIDYDVACEDSVGMLDRMKYLGGMFSGKNAKTLIDEIMTGTLLNYSVDPALNSETVSGYIPICTKREALLYIAFALGAVVDTSRSTEVKIYRTNDTIRKTFDDETTYNKGSLNIANIITKVSLNAYSYALKTETEEIFNQTLPAGDHLLTFDAPHTNYTISGGVLLDSSTNWVKIRISSSQNVTISAKGYEESTIVYEKNNPRTKLTDVANEVNSSNCKLINSSNAEATLQRLYDYIMLTKTINAGVVLDADVSNVPSVGDLVKIPSMFDELLTARVKRLNLKFSPTKLAADVEGVVVNEPNNG